jgi:hypothetical protein
MQIDAGGEGRQLHRHRGKQQSVDSIHQGRVPLLGVVLQRDGCYHRGSRRRP